MTPDLSANCFCGDHTACHFGRCACPCHREPTFEDIYHEPPPVESVPAFTDEEPDMAGDLKIGDRETVHRVCGHQVGTGAFLDDGKEAIAVRFYTSRTQAFTFTIPPCNIDQLIADLRQMAAHFPHRNAGQN